MDWIDELQKNETNSDFGAEFGAASLPVSGDQNYNLPKRLGLILGLGAAVTFIAVKVGDFFERDSKKKARGIPWSPSNPYGHR